MSVTVPSTMPALDLSRFAPLSPVRAADLQATAQAQAYTFARRGVRAPIVWRVEPWQTTSGSYTRVDAGAASRDLEEQVVLRLERELVVASAASVQLQLHVFGAQLDCRATVYAPDTDTTLGTITTTWAGPTGRWASAILTLTSAQADEGGSAGPPRALLISLEARATSATASLYQAHLRAALATSATIP